jgi:predicted NAD/FAD-binding protein
MKIAIIGSGISGMTAGHLLAPSHEVHLFESQERLGGHTHTHEVEVSSGKYLIDTGFIVHNDKNYPHFVKLMNKLKVATQASHMSFSVKVEETGLEYNGTTLNSLFCQRKNLINVGFYRMIFDIMRFNKQATQYYLENENLDDPKTLEQYLIENKYSEEFTETYIMPMGAAIWSASREEMKKFPLGFFVRFFHHHGMLSIDDRPQWRTLVGGSKSYIAPLTENFKQNIHLSCPVTAVTRKESGVEIEFIKEGIKSTKTFDQVIFATHADTTMKILQNPTAEEKGVLSGFSYRPNDVTLHTDTSILPRTALGHAAWNYFLPKHVRESVAVTYHMNILQSIKSPETFLVSLNLDDMIDPKKVIKKIPYSHPVYTLEAVKSQTLWGSISGKDRLHYCGAYWGNGFHEDGVKSGVKVAQSLGVNW